MLMYKIGYPSLSLGVTLIELILTLSISLLLLSVMMAMYLTSEHSHHLQFALSEIQENAYTTIHILDEEIHKAGYIGCAKLTQDFAIISKDSYSLSSKNALVVKQHELVVRHASFPYASLKKITNDLLTLDVDNNVKFAKGDWIIISSCQQAEIARISQLSQNTIRQRLTLDKPLHCRFAENTEVSKLEINRLYIAPTKRWDKSGMRVSALFLENIKKRKIELVENISQLNFKNSKSSIEFDFKSSSSIYKKHWYSYIALNTY